MSRFEPLGPMCYPECGANCEESYCECTCHGEEPEFLAMLEAHMAVEAAVMAGNAEYWPQVVSEVA